jgi:O-acetyl-ADP-ribose deacetylase (regulator of RNase III)
VANTLELAEHIEAEKVSLPAISSGIYGFPKELCANIMLTKTVQWCAFQYKVALIQENTNQ